MVEPGKNLCPHLRVDLTQSITRWPREVKLRRALWQALVRPVYLCLPGPASGMRVRLLRLMGARIGRYVLIEPKVDVLMPWNLMIDANCAVGRAVNFYNFAPVRIGSQTLISQHAFFCTGSHDYTHPHMPLIYAPITVGTECWIAAEVFLGPGVTIGNGAVIGARSVVTRDQPAWHVCAGNPCQPLKPRKIRELSATERGGAAATAPGSTAPGRENAAS
jgi:putative colanic acid biosynthesis acetyltransferase WcaF